MPPAVVSARSTGSTSTPALCWRRWWPSVPAPCCSSSWSPCGSLPAGRCGSARGQCLCFYYREVHSKSAGECARWEVHCLCLYTNESVDVYWDAIVLVEKTFPLLAFSNSPVLPYLELLLLYLTGVIYLGRSTTSIGRKNCYSWALSKTSYPILKIVRSFWFDNNVFIIWFRYNIFLKIHTLSFFAYNPTAKLNTDLLPWTKCPWKYNIRRLLAKRTGTIFR